MKAKILPALILCVTLTGISKPILIRAAAPRTGDETAPPSLVGRVGDTGFIQLRAESFKDLSPDRKMDAYWLARAAIAVNPIAYDQNSIYGLREKHLLEAILMHPSGIDPAVLAKITDYTRLFWGNQGNHNSFTSRKFVPDFTADELKTAAEQARKNGAQFDENSVPSVSLDQELQELEKPIFDPDYQPMLTSKNPPSGEDALVASSNNFYDGVSLKDLVGFTQHYALNSRLVKENGKLVEEVYRAGTPDGKIPPGRYAHELGLAIKNLDMALPYAPESQKKVIRDLIRYYQSGDRADWVQCGIDWVQDKTNPDFSNGFVEVYKDVRGQKGAIQGFVTVVDEKMNHLMTGFATHAAYFEQRAPWDAKYKNPKPKPPVVNADEALIETGDFNVGTIGDNLPNESEIHEKYGSKSFIFTGSIRALNRATGSKVSAEFAYSPEEISRARRYGDLAENLFTAMHEVIGHGSGKLSPKLTHEPAYYLKEYFSTLEETRADLMAMWNFWDPKLLAMGVMPNYDVAKAAYDGEARAALVQLREVPTGDTIEEDHRRGTQLIVNFIRDKTGAIQPVERDGKVYLVVKDYAKMRQGVGMLLAELMRIKAEGDYNAAQALITKYGIHFNTAWRDQVIARYKTLNLPTYWVGINPELDLKNNADGKPADVEISYPRDIVKQQLRYTEIAGE
ncbi:MAG TPA: peptidase M49 [Terriglobia bacterium]|nr:peptidase M49 [Terriglobia bacterium]